jgi:hypothetical protein
MVLFDDDEVEIPLPFDLLGCRCSIPASDHRRYDVHKNHNFLKISSSFYHYSISKLALALILREIDDDTVTIGPAKNGCQYYYGSYDGCYR